MGRKQFSSFDVAAIVKELQNTILEHQVSNIYQVNEKTLLFKFRQRDKPVSWLIIESGSRIHLTSYSMDKPRVPSTFCMALRKHLRNSRLMNIRQHNFERVLLLTFKTWAGSMQLSVELFGEGNIILVDQKNEILQAMRFKRMRDRVILRGKPFLFAPSNAENPLEMDSKALSGRLQALRDLEVVKALAGPIGIGGLYAEEALLRANIDKTILCDALSESDLQLVSDTLHNMLSDVVNDDSQPCIVSREDGFLVNVVPFKLALYEGYVYECYDSFNQAVDEFYIRVNAIEKKTSTANEIIAKFEVEADRLRRMVNRQSKALAKAEAGISRNKEIGDAIYAQMTSLQMLLQRFLDGEIKGKKWKEIISEVVSNKDAGVADCMFFNSFDSKHMVIDVTVTGLTFSLRLRNNLFDNAAGYYQRYKRSKRKLEGIKKALDKSQTELKELEMKIKAASSESISLNTISKEISERKIKQKKWFEKFRWFYSSDNFLVVGGKDAVSNEVLVKRHTNKEDVVLHAEIFGAPFIVIKTNGKKPSEQCLHEASVFAASYSRAWREGFSSVDVYWVNPSQLSKAGPSGEYVPHGAFAVHGTRNWMRGVSLRLAIGVVEEDNDLRFIGGPTNTVDSLTEKYVVIGPGDLKGKTFLKSLLESLSTKLSKGGRERMVKVSVEEIREFVPYGMGRQLDKMK
ncbi:MAG: ribosome rescue protein RqcH [Candidatus Bathyarchaeota archaeon]